ncbi:unnamed protein product [Symbiodinium sp. CCMP2592]|nr:unnamed protein product [Symbiodinium sp. CCMP2592]
MGWQNDSYEDSWSRDWQAWESSSWDWQAWESPAQPANYWHDRSWKDKDDDKAWKSPSQPAKDWHDRSSKDNKDDDQAWKSKSSSSKDDEAWLWHHFEDPPRQKKGQAVGCLEKRAAEHQPDTVESMKAHLEKLAKADLKMKQRLEELKYEEELGKAKAKKEADELGKANPPSSSSSSETPQGKPPKLPKVEETKEEEVEEEVDWDADEEDKEKLGKASPAPQQGRQGKKGFRSTGEVKLTPGRKLVQLDFHNCLEKQGSIPAENVEALHRLCDHTDVYVCSYVTTYKREKEVTRQLKDLEKSMQKRSPELRLKLAVTYDKVGELGKAAIADYNSASYCIDDAWRVISECLEYKVCEMCYAVQTPEQNHSKFLKRKGVKVVKDFPEAVNDILDLLPLNKKNLQKVPEAWKSLKEKVEEAAAASEDPLVQAAVLKESLTDKEAQSAWGKHKTYLKNAPEGEQAEHAWKSKKEKGLSAALFLLQSEGKKYMASKQVVGALEKVKKKDAWESEKTMLTRWTEQELQAHLASGRVSWRQDPSTPGVWEYKDNQRIVRTSEGTRGATWESGVEGEQTPDNLEKFQQLYGDEAMAMPSSGMVSSSFKGPGKGGSKGSGKPALKGKPGQLALEDGKADDEGEEPSLEEQVAKAEAAVRKAMSQAHKCKTELEETLEKVKGTLSKSRLAKSTCWLASLEKQEGVLKTTLKKKQGLAALKKVLETTAQVIKQARDERKELRHLENKAPSVASSKGKCWKMDQELGKAQRKNNDELPEFAKEALEKDEVTSSLAAKLLALWAHGKLSATMIRELASLAVVDGAKHPDLLEIAQAGNWGEQPGNIHKQLMRRFVRNVGLDEACKVSIRCLDNKACLGKDEASLEKDPEKLSVEKDEEAQVFLPHLVFANLGANYPEFFKKTFNCDSLGKFWKQVEKSGDSKLNAHPMTLEKDWREKTVPLFLHGDGVEFQSRDSLLTFSFGALGCGLSSLETNLYLASFPKSCAAQGTWEPIGKVLKWSFESLGKGFHPETDYNGLPLEKGSPLYENRGKPLHPDGWKAYIWAIIGDHDFFANHLKLGHWASHFPCWECDAENWKGCCLEKHYKQISLEKQTFRVWTPAEHAGHPVSNHALFQLPGVTAANVRGDPLHILFTKGLYGHLIGGILHYACYYEGPGVVAKKKPWERLALIFSQVQAEYSEKQVACRLTNLKLSMLCDPKNPWKRSADLDCKGGEAKHLLPCLVPVLKRMFSLEKPHEQKMISAANCLEKLVALWDEAGPVLTDQEFSRSLNLGKGFLDDYSWLHDWSLEKGRNSFAVVAKHHTFIHLLWNSKFLNPRMQWCFKSEDFVGQLSRLAHSISMGVASSRLSLKVANKYRVLLHLLIRSERFLLTSQSIWED